MESKTADKGDYCDYVWWNMVQYMLNYKNTMPSAVRQEQNVKHYCISNMIIISNIHNRVVYRDIK
jgi:hypothetical protein